MHMCICDHNNNIWFERSLMIEFYAIKILNYGFVNIFSVCCMAVLLSHTLFVLPFPFNKK